MPGLVIAVAQTCPVAGDVSANLAGHLPLIERAAREGAQIVIFPELSLTGYEIPLAESLAFTPGDARLAPLVDAAAGHEITVVAGAPVRLGTRLHIASFILRPDRSSLLYTKRRLGAFGESARVDGVPPPAEATVFAAGSEDPLLELDGTPAAFAICADIGDPAHAARAAGRGARVYLASMFVIPSDFAGDEARLVHYAREHRMVTALANFGAPSGGLASAGRSSIWSADGELLARLEPAGPGVAISGGMKAKA